MTAQNLIPLPELQFFDNNGAALANGSVTTYAADGATLKATYQDANGTVLNQNPVPLDTAGRGQIWGTGAYVWLVQDSLGNTIYKEPTQDPTLELGATAFGLSLLQATNQAAAQALLGIGSAGIPPGTILFFGGASVPSGWQGCDGTAVSRSSYPLLFAAINTTWGSGDGSTTFNVPDMRGRVGAMADLGVHRLTNASDSAFGSSAAVGNVGGDQILQGHTHTVTDPGHSHAVSTQDDGYGGGSLVHFGTTDVGGTSSATTGITIASAGTGASQNVQPTGVGLYIIQLQ